ncbi:hypothetical protein AB434_1568 [Heyndrickxia coagulans]|nr:hypothetical protein AB434_1568 [Heyndrickxia coagulans]
MFRIKEWKTADRLFIRGISFKRYSEQSATGMNRIRPHYIQR